MTLRGRRRLRRLRAWTPVAVFAAVCMVSLGLPFIAIQVLMP